MRRLMCVLAAMGILGSSAAAQNRSFIGAVGVQHLETEGTGLSMSLGVAVRRSIMMVSLPLDITILPNNNSRYQTDTFSNGQSRCRDTTNGQFADTSLCGPRAVLGISVDALAFTRTDSTHSMGFGGGFRAGTSPGFFAAAAFAFALPSGASWSVKARGGPSLIELSVGGALPWR